MRTLIKRFLEETLEEGSQRVKVEELSCEFDSLMMD